MSDPSRKMHWTDWLVVAALIIILIVVALGIYDTFTDARTWMTGR